MPYSEICGFVAVVRTTRPHIQEDHILHSSAVRDPDIKKHYLLARNEFNKKFKGNTVVIQIYITAL
jgi:hypothetical protein